jgi:transposase
MRKIKEVLRLHHEKNLSDREIAKSVQIGRATVKDYLLRAKKAEVGWPLPSDLDETSLEHLLFPSNRSISPERRQMPSLEYLHQELKRKGVTLQLLWHEYKQNHPDGYQYSQFCRIYQQWTEKLDPYLRQTYRGKDMGDETWGT